MSLLDVIRFARRTAELGAVSRWSPERRERLVARRLRRLVGQAAARSRFYARRYAGIELGAFRLTDLPPTTKEELRDNFNDTLTDPRVRLDEVRAFVADPANLGAWFLGRYAVSHTSGSQGPPLPIVQDRATVELLFAVMSARANAGRKPTIIEALRRLRRPARVAVVALHRGFYPSAAAFEFMPELTWPFTSVARFSAADPDLIDRLNAFQPHSLVGYASVLEGLSLRAGELQLAVLRQIANSSEQLTSRARDRIENAFGVTVMDHYGTGECLFLADGCPTNGGCHVNSDWAILENVDDEYRPVPPGEPGRKVLVTNLANRVQPFIRYEVHDRIVMTDAPCRCGSRLPRIARIEGRSADALWCTAPDGKLRPLPAVLIHDCLDALDLVREWRATQTEPDRIRLEVELLPGGPGAIDAAAVLATLRASGLPETARVDLVCVPRLEADPRTGKFRRVISEVFGSNQDRRSRAI
ncbi:MAG: phenylacetate--CoA ligase family protein [Planctomycetia bacterium]